MRIIVSCLLSRNFLNLYSCDNSRNRKRNHCERTGTERRLDIGWALLS
ncbi:hypothetical protein HanIR_Chr13g0619591 [Helianthus annuus]|nr:hypothetical protein HanIR_Chr13g0619591 [Helianthus annuus]